MHDHLNQTDPTVVTHRNRPGEFRDGVYHAAEEVTAISGGAFLGDPLHGIHFPPQLESIGPEAFAFCQNLEEIVVPKSITVIPQALFYCCHKLKKVVFEAVPTSIGPYAFAGCYLLTQFVVDGVSRTLEDLIGLNIAQPYAFFGCGCDIREEIVGDNHDIPVYESAYYRQELWTYQDARISWDRFGLHHIRWKRENPKEFRWTPGIPREELLSWLQKNHLRLPEEYRNALEKTNGAELFRSMMTMYAVPGPDADPWQQAHSLEWLNSPEVREQHHVPRELYLLGTTDLGTWFGVVQPGGKPCMADFYIHEGSLRVYREYRKWKDHIMKNFQLDESYWEFEDHLQALEDHLDSLVGTEWCYTDLEDIREEVQNRKSSV